MSEKKKSLLSGSPRITAKVKQQILHDLKTESLLNYASTGIDETKVKTEVRKKGDLKTIPLSPFVRRICTNANSSIMKTIIILFILVVYFAINGYPQACGQGILTLNIYTLNGNKIKGASYEIFPAPKALIEKYKDRDIYGSGIMISDIEAFNIIAGDSLTSRFEKHLQLSSISKSGQFETNLKFKTFETLYFPIILKATIEHQTLYILGNYFGGCNREVCLLWNEKYSRLL